MSHFCRVFGAMAGAVPGRVNPRLYYAAYDYLPEDLTREDDDIAYTYWYCVESAAEAPAGMQKKAIPRAKYAEFVYDPKAGALNGETIGMPLYDYIDGVWLPGPVKTDPYRRGWLGVTSDHCSPMRPGS